MSKHNGTRRRTQQSRFKPRLELLEDRLALAVRTWDGGGATNNWTNESNWTNNIAPVGGDDLVFPAGVSDKVADNNFSADTHFKSITVAGGYTLRGARVLLGVGGITSSGSSNIINHKIHLGAAGSGNRTIHVNTGSTLFIDDDVVGGNGLNKTGGGDLSFLNNNSYSGLTDIIGGRLFIQRDEGLGAFNSSAAGTIIRSGAQLLLNDNLPASVLRVDEPITMAGGSIRALNDVHLRGNLGTSGSATISHEGSPIERLLITGQISGPGGVTIANANGQVWLQGFESNTYTGTTTVNGKLRLDNWLGDAIPGDIQINSTGGVRLMRSNQIDDDATVTASNGGTFFAAARHDTFHKLWLHGGRAEGFEMDLIQFGVSLFLDLPILNRLIDPDNGSLNLDQFEATSTSGQTAETKGINLFLTGEDGVATILDGPRADDFIVNGFLGHDGLNEDTITIEGGGTIKIPNSRLILPGADFTTDFHFVVNHGHLRLMQDDIDLTLFGPSETTRATVNNGGRFSGTSSIGELIVHAGGRVRPGSLGTSVNLGIADVTFGDTGKLEVSENLVFHPGSILEVKLNGFLAGTGHDQIVAGGTVTLDGAFLDAILGPNAVVGHNFRIIDKSGAQDAVGEFAVPAATAPFQTVQPTGQRLAFDYDGGNLFNDVVLELQNTPPKAPDLALNTTEINEGGTVTATGSLVDPDAKDKLRLFINWGDGSRQEVHRPGRDLFSFTHRYRQDGVYTARFEWIDQTGQGNSREFTITVNNVAPALKLRTFRTFSTGLLLASGWLSDAGDDRYTATLDFGDGTSRSKALNRRDYFAIAHKYRNPGNYTLTLTLVDSQGAESVFQREVIIS